MLSKLTGEKLWTCNISIKISPYQNSLSKKGIIWKQWCKHTDLAQWIFLSLLIKNLANTLEHNHKASHCLLFLMSACHLLLHRKLRKNPIFFVI